MILALLLATTTAIAPRPTHHVRHASLSAADKEFVMKAAMANNYELKAAELASTMSTSAAVKSFAAMMTRDHSALGAKVKATVAKADPSVQLPAGVSDDQQKHLDALRTAGTKFDAEYRSQMIDGHADVRSMFESFVKRSDANVDLKTVISGAIPTVVKHWNSAKALPEK